MLRLAPRPVFLAGREELLAELDARLAGMRGRAAGGGVVRAGRRGQDQRGGGVRAPAPGRGGGGLAVPRRGPGGAGGRVRRAGRPARRRGGGGPRDPVASVHGVLAASPGRVAAGVRQRAGPGLGGPFVPPAGPGPGADHQPEPDLAARPGPGGAGAGPGGGGGVPGRTGPATRTGGRPGSSPVELGGLPLALEQAAAYVQATGATLAGYLASFRQRRAGPAGPRRARRVRQDGGHHLAAGVRAAGSKPPRARPGCCGCWRSARPRRSRCACCCSPARAWPGCSARRWRRCWCRCWRTRWRPGTRSRRCAGTRWSPRPTDGSVSVHRLVQAVTADQMPAELAEPVAAGRRRPDRGRDPRRRRAARGLADMRGAAAARPGGLWPMTAAGWRGSPTTSDLAAATRPPATCQRNR